MKVDEQVKFNFFAFFSTFARSLIEIFISLYLFRNGFSLHLIVLFYFLVNLFAIPLSYLFVKLGEKIKYIYIMLIGLIGFVIVEFLLRNIIISKSYLVLIAFCYSIYRRGYWVARRFYITKIIPNKGSSGVFSIVVVMGQIASILAGYVGSYILNDLSFEELAIISSIILFISIMPLCFIRYDDNNIKVELKKNMSKYKLSNYFLFSMYEVNNLFSFIFPIYIALYVSNSYSLAGNINAISNIAVIIFVIVYGKVIKNNKNYVVISTFLVLICNILKFSINSYFILFIYFIEGIISKMQSQSVNKIYFENRGNMDLINYNLIYQIVECFARMCVAFILLFINDVRVMIVIVICVIHLLLMGYVIFSKKRI